MSDPDITPIALMKCPHCGYELDSIAAFGFGERAPKPGDITLCIECALPTVLDPLLTPRKPHPGEVEAACLLDHEFWRDMTEKQRLIRQSNAQ